MDPQGFRHADQRDQKLPAAGRIVPQEEHVKFHDIKFIVLQHIQRGIPAAEVVQPYGKTGIMEPAENPLKGFGIFQHEALCYFQSDRFARNAVLIKGGRHFFEEIVMTEILPGKIHGKQVQQGSAALKAPVKGTGLPQYLHIQVIDQACSFQDRNKISR